MTIKNRLKKILEDLGYKVKPDRQPLNQKALNTLGMTSFRVMDIIENREDKPDLNIAEIHALCKFFGVMQNELLINTPTTEDYEMKVVFHRVETKMSLSNEPQYSKAD